MKTEHLTFTRFVAAIVIVFFHFGVDAPPFDNNFFRPLIVNAGLSVSYFFILSGFVMIVAYGNKARPFNTALYLRNRAARILPLYYTAIVLMIIYYFLRVNVLNTPSNYYVNTYDTLLNSLLIQAWIPEKAFTLNPPAWSLSVEAFFYLAFPFIFYRLYKKLSYRAFMMFTIAFFIVSQLVFHFLIYTWPEQLYFFYFLPALRLNEFLIGNGLGALFLMQRKGWKNSGYLLVVLLTVSIYVLRKDVSPLDFHNGLFAIFFAPMLFVLAMNQGAINRLFSKRPFVFLGEISYGVYLLQYPVYFFFTSTLTFFGRKITPPLFYVYLLILLVVSAASYIFIELPLRNRIRKTHATTQTKAAQ
ncbi:MAG: acyltransferase [Chitinophagaceae bacterium]|nr:acyltransferase [Chitinophagaceae bacterium]